uniref:Uncharacterized protein n=1 Tax=Romanomermis culicivorax TaxID=13658 RepID=A0A915HPD3_ROMCU
MTNNIKEKQQIVRQHAGKNEYSCYLCAKPVIRFPDYCYPDRLAILELGTFEERRTKTLLTILAFDSSFIEDEEDVEIHESYDDERKCFGSGMTPSYGALQQ